MKRNFLPNYVGISMTKAQFCFCTGCTPYMLTKVIHANPAKWQSLGMTKYAKLLMPSAIRELLTVTGLRIDIDLYAQYVAGQRGAVSPIQNQ